MIVSSLGLLGAALLSRNVTIAFLALELVILTLALTLVLPGGHLVSLGA